MRHYSFKIVNIKESFDKDDTEVPFLVEIDDYAELDGGIEGEDYFKIGSLFYSVKYPEKDERYTDEQFDYIKSYITKVNSLCNKKNVTLSDLSEYIDIDSFIDYYLIQEIVIQPDIDNKSVYMYKSSNGKLKMGPLWDYDWAFGGPSLAIWYKYKPNENELCTRGTWFYTLLSNSSEFKQAVKERFYEIKDIVVATAYDFKQENEYISRAAHKDWLRHHFFNGNATYSRNLEQNIELLLRRIKWLENEFNSY